MNDGDQQSLAGVSNTTGAQAPARIPDPEPLDIPEVEEPAVDPASRADAMKRAEGSACIYVERSTIMLATIKHIATSTDAVVIILLDGGCPGVTPPTETLMGPRDGGFAVGAAWSEGEFGGSLWRGSPYCPWAIHLDQSLIGNLREFAALLVGKSRRKRSVLLRQRVRDEQYECPESAEVRLARAAHTTACEVLAGREDFLRGTWKIVELRYLQPGGRTPRFRPLPGTGRKDPQQTLHARGMTRSGQPTVRGSPPTRPALRSQNHRGIPPPRREVPGGTIGEAIRSAEGTVRGAHGNAP